MEYIIKKTNQLTQEELVEMNNLFNKVFDKKRPIEIMMNQYTKNPFGFSYHVNIVEDGKIVGSNTGIPCYYLYKGEKVKFINNIDTFIDVKYRGIQHYFTMMRTSYKAYISDGFVFAYAFPNDDGNIVVTKSKLMQSLGNMYVYCLPYRIGGIKKGLSFLNWGSMLFSLCWVNIMSIFASSKVANWNVIKDNATYNVTRYERSDGNYNKQDKFVYKIIDFEGIRAAFLIDVYEKSPKNFCEAVKFILKHESKNFDILLYPGHLPFSLTGMIKIPHKFEPKHFHFTGTALIKGKFDSDILKIENWDVNLSNYDVI